MNKFLIFIVRLKTYSLKKTTQEVFEFTSATAISEKTKNRKYGSELKGR